MKYFYFIALMAFTLASCGDTYEFWDISKFKMDNRALEDEEEIKILYTSQGPDYNRKLEYYIHLVVVSQKTGDTVNILTTADNDISIADKHKVFNFFNQDNVASKLLQMDVENLKDIKELEEITSKPLKNIDKVARDPNFDFIADNNYPTVIGVIGTVTDSKK